MRRVTQMKFAPGMYVFPGGRLDPRDTDETTPVTGRPDDRGARHNEALARGLLVCAARETFEETGVLLATGDRALDAAAEERRQEVESGSPLSHLLLAHGVHIDAGQLPLWSHWVTPEFESRRFDVRFYVARLPEGQMAHDISGESDGAQWLRPNDALDMHYAGDLPMLPPTSATLREISEYSSVEDVVVAASQREILPLLPHQELSTGVWQLLHAYDRTVISHHTEARILSEVDGVKRRMLGDA